MIELARELGMHECTLVILATITGQIVFTDFAILAYMAKIVTEWTIVALRASILEEKLAYGFVALFLPFDLALLLLFILVSHLFEKSAFLFHLLRIWLIRLVPVVGLAFFRFFLLLSLGLLFDALLLLGLELRLVVLLFGYGRVDESRRGRKWEQVEEGLGLLLGLLQDWQRLLMHWMQLNLLGGHESRDHWHECRCE